MSTEMIRRCIRPDELRTLMNRTGSPMGSLAKYVGTPTQDPLFTPEQVLRGVYAAVGDRIAEVFFSVDKNTAMKYAAAIIRDHVLYPSAAKKDLQIALVANWTIRLVRAKSQPRAQRFAYGEDLIRACKFQPEFKLALKVLMFDKKGIDSPWVLTQPYPTNVPSNPGVWST